MANQKMRIKLKSYDHNLIDQAAERIVDVAKKMGSKVS
ncbi:MAG: 30S ribosomal protein S10, partial [Clostridia bacterium]